MSAGDPPIGTDRLDELTELYCDGLIEDSELGELEDLLRGSETARLRFVRAFHAHTELVFAIRSRVATDEVLENVLAARSAAHPPSVEPDTTQGGPGRWMRPLVRGIAAAALILAGGAGVLLLRGDRSAPPPEAQSRRASGLPSGNVAWLLNAQNCIWAGTETEMPGRDMRSGKVLRLRSGLAEIEFEQGARVLLNGPAELVLLGGGSARLVHGSLTARVPEQARGFTVFSPRGRVIDQGTAFGLAVEDDGATTVRVFEGLVEASPLDPAEWPNNVLRLHRDQTARLDHLRATFAPAASTNALRFVRSIVPPPVIIPRSTILDFRRLVPGTILDANGGGTGLTHRLPGTGAQIANHDPHLRVESAARSLLLTTTRSDVNTQDGMPVGEYLGLRLASLGFTRDEDFEVGATFTNIPKLNEVGQFGLYAGTDSQSNIRGGLISRPDQDRYNLFLVNNKAGIDQDLNEVGLMSRGQDLRLTLRRMGGRYSLLVENLSLGSSNTLTVKHPPHLDGLADIYVGVFGANTQSEVSRTLTLKELKATVWTWSSEVRPGAE